MKKIEPPLVILILLHLIAFSGTSNQPKNGFKRKVEIISPTMAYPKPKTVFRVTDNRNRQRRLQREIDIFLIRL